MANIRIAETESYAIGVGLELAPYKNRDAFRGSLFSGKADQAAVIEKNEEGAVGRLLDFADALVQVFQQVLFGDDFVTVENEANQAFRAHPTDQDVAFPLRKHVARVEDQCARRDVRIPEIDRLLDAFLLCQALARDEVAVVAAAVADIGPAIVSAGLDDADFVSAAGAVLDHPEFARGGIDRGTFGIAMTVGIRFGQHRRLIEERIVLGDRAVFIDAYDAAREIAQDVRVGDFVVCAVVTRLVETETVGAGDEQGAVRREHDAAIHTVEQHLHIFEAALIIAQAGAGQALFADAHAATFRDGRFPDIGVEILERPGARRFTGWRRKVREINHAIVREIRIDDHVVERFGGDDFGVWHAGDGRGIEAVHLRDAEKAITLGDQNFAVGQQRERPWSVEARNDGVDFERGRRLRGSGSVGLRREGGLRQRIIFGFDLRAPDE